MKIPTRLNRLLDSYRNRYLALALMLTLILVLTALIGYVHVRKSTYSHVGKMSSRSQASILLTAVLADINNVQKLLQDIVIDPGRHAGQRLAVEIEKLDATLHELDTMANAGAGENARVVTVAMKKDLDELKRQASYLISIRSRDARWFPATAIMEERLLPNFVDSLTLLPPSSRPQFLNSQQFSLTPLSFLVIKINPSCSTAYVSSSRSPPSVSEPRALAPWSGKGPLLATAPF